MLSSYEVGAVFRIADQATPTLLRIATELERIHRLAQGAANSLNALGRFRGTAMLTGLQAVERHLGGVATASGRAESAVVANMARADAAINTATVAAGRLTTELRAAGAAAGSIPRIPPIIPPGGRIPGGGMGPGNPGGGGGGGGSGGGSGGHNNWSHVGVGLGMAGFFGVHEIGHGLKDVLKHASELEHVRQQMMQAGFKEHDIGEALAKSWAQAEKYGLNVAKVMADIKELAMPFGSVEHAVEFIEPLERMRIVLNAVKEGKGNESAEAVYKMARAGELKGLQDPKDFLSYFDQMTKVISASGGKIGPHDFMQVTQYGRLASMGWNEEFYTRYLPTLAQTMGASQAGTSLMSLFGTLVQGKASQRSLGRMMDLGLVEDPSKIEYNKKGEPKGFNPGAIAGTDLLIKNPFKWAQEVLLPLLEKKYGNLDDTANKEKAIEDLGGLFGNRTSAAAIAELALRGKTFNKDAQLIEQARGLGGAEKLQKEDPNSATARLKGAWENLLTAIGGPGVKVAVDGMNSLASGITSMTKWANENPGVMKIVLEGMLGLGIAFAALTAAGVVAAAALLIPGGAVALAVTTLVGVMGTIAAFNWKEVEGMKPGYLATIAKDFKDWVTAIGNADIKGAITGSLKGLNDLMLGIPLEMARVVKDITVALGTQMAPIATAIGTEIMSWPGRLAETIAGMGAAIVAKIKEALGSLLGGLFSRTSFNGGEGGGLGGMIQNANFTAGGGANDNAVAAGGADVSGAGSYGGSSVARGLRAGGMGSGGSEGGGVGAATGVGSSAGNLTRLIEDVSRRAGIDPRIMQGIRAGESGHRADYDKKHDALESSWGPFQLNRRRGLGVLFEKETGLDVRNPGTIAAQADWVAKYIAKHGPRALKNWMGYHGPRNADPRWGDSGYKPSPSAGVGAGAADVLIPRSMQGRAPGRVMEPNAPPPTAGPPPRQQAPQMQNVELHVDGRRMAGVVIKHVAAAGKFPKHTGGMDTHGAWRPPGTTLTDAA